MKGGTGSFETQLTVVGGVSTVNCKGLVVSGIIVFSPNVTFNISVLLRLWAFLGL